MKKGFTLIELLAVILILGIIALIAVPQITNVIEDAREQANLRSVEGHLHNIENNLAINMLHNASLKGTYSFNELNFLNYPQNDTIRCESYDIDKMQVISASKCLVNDKTYCFTDSHAYSCNSQNERLYASYNGKLHICGTKMCNQHNEVFRLTGASYGDFSTSNSEEEYSKKSLSTLKSWGANGFRIFINGLATYSGMDYYIGNEEEYINRIKTVIDNVIANDMYIIVNWNSNGTNFDPLIDKAKEALTTVANLYPNDPHIIYEIWNESGNSIEWSTIKAYSNEVIPVIRAISPDAIILVATPGNDSQVDVVINDMLSFENIMYTHHTYSTGFTDTTLQKIKNAIEAGVPIYETEWAATPTGTSLGHDKIYQTHALAYAKLLDKYDIGYMFFCFHATKWSYGFVAPGNWNENLPDSILTPNAKFFKKILKRDYSTDTHLMIANNTSTGKYYRSSEYKDRIVSIEFKNKINVPNNAEAHWDLSFAGDNSVVGYVVPTENNKLKLVIAANGYINAPRDSTSLFRNLSNLTTIDFTNFKTEYAYLFQHAFGGDTSLTTIDLSSFNMTDAQIFDAMFYGDTSLKNVNISTWNPTKVSSLKSLFAQCTSLEKVDMSNLNLTSSTDVTGMLNNVKTGAKFIVKNQIIADILTNLNSDITIELTPSFENDSWQDIVSNIRNGKSNIYAPTDLGKDNQLVKEIDLGELGKHKVRVANVSNCTGSETSETACGVVIEFIDMISLQKFNNTGTSTGGYPSSSVYNYVTETIYNALPTEIKNIIINTTVVSGHGNKSGEVNTTLTNQKIYLLSMMEVYGDTESTRERDSAYNTTRQLDYYRLNPTTNDKLKTGSNIWWLRTASLTHNANYIAVTNNGYVAHYATNSFGVSPAFRIG